MTENFENWEEMTPEMEKELKTVRKKLRIRNCCIVVTSVVLVAALLLATVKLIIPAVEKRYWDPTVCTYLEDATDLELTMATYNELFGHGQYLIMAQAQKNGFASYSVDAAFSSWQTMDRVGGVSFRTASLVKGELGYPVNFWNNEVEGSFVEQTPAEGITYARRNKEVMEYLRQLPEYVEVSASVTFSKDMTMSELLSLSAQYRDDAQFIWAVLRDGVVHNSKIGVHLAAPAGYQYQSKVWQEKGYPKLFGERYTWHGEDVQQHVKSMLKFMNDQLEKGQGILPSNEDPDYYAKTLRYMEEEGVKAYGCYVIATPQTLLKMIEDGVVSYVSMTDARIGLEF